MLQTLSQYVSAVPYLSIAGSYHTGFDALVGMQHTAADLIITDTYLPDMSIFEFLDLLPNRPQVIFTSIAPLFAVEAFALGATDFMLKPFTFQRFMQGVNRAGEQIESRQLREQSLQVLPKARLPFIFVQSEYKAVRIDLPEVLFIEGLKDYVKIHLTQGKPVLTITRIKHIEERLPEHFLRIHRSYIVNIHRVDALQKNRVFIGDREIPVGDMYASRLQEWLA